ncbi:MULTISPECIES: hypothetical protein [Vibrio]|uniref:hypothetical protein n=1 Tax=Vibrio TaxID=662 RepID=UPI001C92D55A|nr:hypothetical protein [Vibrio alginolyticus]MBY4646927.1 hypothetical protein [Vibrio alginolyticus]
MTQRNYSPYCGNHKCSVMPRTLFKQGQFECPCCGWRSSFEKEFIEQYREKWSE